MVLVLVMAMFTHRPRTEGVVWLAAVGGKIGGGRRYGGHKRHGDHDYQNETSHSQSSPRRWLKFILPALNSLLAGEFRGSLLLITGHGARSPMFF